jgi:tocopherol O-methyltransferase
MLLKDRIVQHYDELSPFYKDIWGVHIHHGYWKNGTETKEDAQEQLIKELIARANIRNGCRILDVGCGLGGSAIFLSKILSARTTGITISPVQVAIGNALAREQRVDVQLMEMDAEALDIKDRFDVVWSVEAISHLSNRRDSIRSMARVLEHGGQLVIADWFKSPTTTAAQERQFLEPIERAMLVPRLDAPSAYVDYMNEVGLTLTLFEDLSAHVVKTWDLAIELIRNPALWKFAAARGKDFVAFLEGFAAMRAGYRSKTFVYGALIGKKP